GASTGCSPAFRNPVQTAYHGLTRSLDQRNELFLGRTGFGASARKRAECVGRALSSPWRRVGVGESGGRGRILGHCWLRPALRACSKKSTTLPRQMHPLQRDPCNEEHGEILRAAHR